MDQLYDLIFPFIQAELTSILGGRILFTLWFCVFLWTLMGRLDWPRDQAQKTPLLLSSCISAQAILHAPNTWGPAFPVTFW